MLHHAVFFNRPSEACWDSRESGILENLGSGILYTYDVCPNLCPKIGRLCTWKFVLHKFSILDISATVGPSSILSLFWYHDDFCVQNWTKIGLKRTGNWEQDGLHDARQNDLPLVDDLMLVYRTNQFPGPC